MLHPANLPACSPEMECILDLQERLLDFSCRHGTFVMSDLEAEFGQELAEWLHKNRHNVLDPLKLFMNSAPEARKKQILGQFRHDRSFMKFADDPTFRFELVVTSPAAPDLGNVQRWLMKYYAQLGESAFHPLACGHADIAFTKGHWWDGYKTSNPGTSTCAVCDASLNAGGQSIEHFFPKTQYPALSVHPANLLPLCRICNNDVKKQKDPLAHNTITELFLPYRRYVRPETTLVFGRDGHGGYTVRLSPMHDDPISQKRIANLEYLFDLSNRWSRALGEASETAISRARQFIGALRAVGKAVDAQTISTSIDTACDLMERNWGRFHYEYLATQWLRWAKTDAAAILWQELATA